MDEDVPTTVTQGLRRRGVDALTVQGAGLCSAADEEHLAFALSQGRVIFTYAASIHHAGIVYAPQQMPIGAAIRGLMLIVD